MVSLSQNAGDCAHLPGLPIASRDRVAHERADGVSSRPKLERRTMKDRRLPPRGGGRRCTDLSTEELRARMKELAEFLAPQERRKPSES